MNDNPETPGGTRRLRRNGPAVAAAALIGVLALGTGLISTSALSAKTTATGTPVATSLVPADFSAVIERVSPAVVHVQVSGHAPAEMMTGDFGQMPKGMQEFLRRFFGEQFGQVPQSPHSRNKPHHPRRGPLTQGIGSGFIIDPAGYIVTNNHVIADAEKIMVTLKDRRRFKAKLIGADPDTDLALLKINAKGPLPYVSFATGPTPRPGQWVIAVGNPFGLDHTATAGIVSATGRSIGAGPYDDFIQIDAPINKGNSGGPTFNLAGQVVGVNAAIYSPNGGSVGIGFAIPASTARGVIAQLKAHGHVERGWLGVEVQQVSQDIADSLGLDRPRGALVASVVDGGPADKAGLKTGDLIVAVNGKKIDQLFTLTRTVAAIKPDTEAKLTVLRGGDSKTISVEIGRRPASKQMASLSKSSGGASSTVLGMKLARNSDGPGVAVVNVDPDGAAATQGLNAGDVIVSVSSHKVTKPHDVYRNVAAARKSGKKSVLLLVERDGERRFVALPLGHA